MNNTKPKELRALLKTLGYSNKQISVRSEHGSMQVEIKDLTIPIKTISSLAGQFESVRYCQHSQEILSGGNYFVSVSYAWETESLEKQTEKFIAFKNLVESIAEQTQGITGESIGNYYVFRHQNNSFLFLVSKPNSSSFEDGLQNIESLTWFLYLEYIQGSLKLETPLKEITL